MYHEIRTKQLIRGAASALKHAVDHSKISLPLALPQFVFLCGANKPTNEVSERRRAVLEFVHRNLPNISIFLAERVFETLTAEGPTINLLDIESDISNFSDFIIIILESPSTFAELGAFSTSKLRSKLIIINNAVYANARSFINLGPLKAITDAANPKHIISYNMALDGLSSLDSIGVIFPQLHKLLDSVNLNRRRSMDESGLNPSKIFNKYSAMFLHDLLYLSGPLLYKEIIELLKLIFGDSNYNKTKTLLALLVSFNVIKRDQTTGLYRSQSTHLYYSFNFDTNKYIAIFRNYMLKNYSERFYEH